MPENATVSTELSACPLQCSDPDQSFNNKITLTPIAGHTCPFFADVKGQVKTNAPLDRETYKRHECLVTVVDTGNPEFSSFSSLIVDVIDVNDCAPKPREKKLALVNIINETISIEFYDEDEGDTDMQIELTKGAKYFALPEDVDASNRRRRHQLLALSLPAHSPVFTLRQVKKLPVDFTELAFKSCDMAGNCATPKLQVTFPGQNPTGARGPGTNKNGDVSTGPFPCPFAPSLTLHTHSLDPPSLLGLRALLCLSSLRRKVRSRGI